MRYSIQEALNLATKRFSSKDRPRLEAEILLSSVLDVERVYLHSHNQELLTQEQYESFKSLIQRACKDEPIEYLTQKVGFYSYEWKIIEGVLIPRPETEVLIDKASELIAKEKIQRIFEFGVGSGIISITLALLHPQINIIGSDINPIALALSQKNLELFAQKYDKTLLNRVRFIESDVLKNQEVFLATSFDLLISNPPYIALDYPLPKNVQYEPKTALFGGVGGEEILHALVDLVKKRSIPFLACEMGYDQKQKMQDRLQGFRAIEFFKDLNDLDRGFLATL